MNNQKYVYEKEHECKVDYFPQGLNMEEHQQSAPSDVVIQSIYIDLSSCNEINKKKVIPRQSSASLVQSNLQNYQNQNKKFYQNHKFNQISDNQDNFSSMKRLSLNKPNLQLTCISTQKSHSQAIGCNIQRQNNHAESQKSMEIIHKITYEEPQQFQKDITRRNTVSNTTKLLCQENKVANNLGFRQLKTQISNKKLCLLNVLHNNKGSSGNCSISESMQNHPGDHLKSEHTFEQSSYPMSLLSYLSPSAEDIEDFKINTNFKQHHQNEIKLEDSKIQKETYFLEGMIQHKQKEQVNPLVSLNAAREFNKVSNLPASSLSQQLTKQRLVFQLKAIIEASRQKTKQKEYITTGKKPQKVICNQIKPLLFKEQQHDIQKSNQDKTQTSSAFYTCISDRRKIYPQEGYLKTSEKHDPPDHFPQLVASRKDSNQETSNDNNRLYINSNSSSISQDNSDNMNSQSSSQCSGVQQVESKILETVVVHQENIQESSKSCSSNFDSEEEQKRICQTSRDNSQLLRMFISEQKELSEKYDDDFEDINIDFIEQKMKACEQTLQHVIEEISKKFNIKSSKQVLSPVLSSFISSIQYSLKSILAENSRKQIQVALNELADVLHRLAVLKDKQGMELSPFAYLGYSTGLHKLSILQFIRTFPQAEKNQHQ